MEPDGRAGVFPAGFLREKVKMNKDGSASSRHTVAPENRSPGIKKKLMAHSMKPMSRQVLGHGNHPKGSLLKYTGYSPLIAET